MIRSFSTSLSGRVRNFTLPIKQPLVPLFEAIVNSINAINERMEKYGGEEGFIDVQVIRGGDKPLSEGWTEESVRGFTIRDNGIGFDEANMGSFMEADSEYKMKIGGKGVGRFSWLVAFSQVHIESVYKREGNGDFESRAFDFTLKNREVDDIVQDTAETGFHTTVSLIDYKSQYAKNTPKQLETIATHIIQHCLVYFLNPKCPTIQLRDENNAAALNLNQLFHDHFATDDKKVDFFVGDKQFHLLNVKINDKKFSSQNQLFLCANDRSVKRKKLDDLIVNLDDAIFERTGFWYLGILTSKYFDENVDMNRLSFNIEEEGNEMLKDCPSLNLIVSEACKRIETFLAQYLDEVQEEKQTRLWTYVQNSAPQYRHLERYAPQEIAALKPHLSDEQLDDELNRIKRKLENDATSECRTLIDRLNRKVISPDEYQQQFQTIVEKVSDINGASLAEYIVHRRIVLNLFESGLEIQPDGKFHLEKYMHDLIYPTRATLDDTPYECHNLWLIDDKLSFSHFLSSDKPFNNSSNEERTDILALNYPVAVADVKNDGTAFNSIVIFELKRPQRDDYDPDDDNPVQQLLRYAKRIRDEKVKDSKGRPIRTTNSTHFHLYAVCDITDKLRDILIERGFTFTPDNLGAYLYNSALNAYVEVITYDKIRNDAEKRNRILFEKLGIR
ncbi:MAG: ATP-binding protein [Thermoguttaceae bacterium]|nr:ATP-binding protein [Thermoguttaceae bacterium]